MEFENKTFISYALGGESERFVSDLEETLQQKGIQVVRSKADSGYKRRIQEFMERIGRGKCVIAVISDEYFKSPNCMFELMEVAKNGDFYDRIFPIVLDDANIFDDLTERLKYIKYWEYKNKELNEITQRSSLADLQVISEEINLYPEIYNRIPELIKTLKDINALTPEIHQQSKFEQLIKAIEKRLNQDTISFEKDSKPSNIQQISTIQQIIIEGLKKDKKKLLKDYKDVDDKKRMTSNPQEKNNLQLQLDSIFKEIEGIEQKLQ